MIYQNQEPYFLQNLNDWSEDISNFFQKEALESVHFKKLSPRLYRKINGYLPTKRIFKEIANFLHNADKTILKASLTKQISIRQVIKDFLIGDFKDVTSRYIFTVDWVNNNYPVFCLDKNLARAFLNSLPPNEILQLNPFAVGGLMILPQELIKSPDGCDVNYLIFRFVRKSETVKAILLREEFASLPCDDYDAIMAFFATENFVYSIQIPTHKTEKETPSQLEKQLNFCSESLKTATSSERELNFVNQIRSLLVQTFLYQQTYRSKEIYTSENRQTIQHKSRASIKALSPIIIGKDYRIQRTQENTNGGTHASPRTHWRSGHWRNQPFGKRDNPQYKTIWLEPVLVGSSVNN